MPKIIITGLLIAFTLIGYSQKKKDITIADLDAVAKNLLNETKGNAVSIGIISNEKQILKQYGEIDKGKSNTPNSSTVFEIASVTKTFTGLLMAKAVADNKLNLNDDIRKYLDGKYPNLEYKGTPITIQNLLTFKTGIFADFPDYRELFTKPDDSLAFRVKKAEDNYTKKQFFDALATVKLDTMPGAVYKHTKLGPELCAAILENLYGKSYESILKEQILDNAGMTNTFLHLKNGEKAANGYNQNGILMPAINLNPWGAAGLLKSTPTDLIKYMQYQMGSANKEINESHRILSEGSEGTFAYCWNVVKDREGKTAYWMHGGAFGTQNIIVVWPEYGLGISIIINQSGPDTFYRLQDARFAIEDLLKPGKKSIIRKIKSKYPNNTNDALAYYKKLKLTNEYYLEEDEINRYGYSLLSSQQPEAALKIFNLYVAEFPNSPNGYNSRGEVYYNQKNYAASRKDYEKSLQLNPQNQNAKEMILKIKGL